jgi:hypothetical protein
MECILQRLRRQSAAPSAVIHCVGTVYTVILVLMQEMHFRCKSMAPTQLFRTRHGLVFLQSAPVPTTGPVFYVQPPTVAASCNPNSAAAVRGVKSEFGLDGRGTLAQGLQSTHGS